MPDEFWQLTPREFDGLCQGYNFRDRKKWELSAWEVANIIQPHVKGRVTPDKLLKPSKVKNIDQEAADFEKMWDKIQRQRKGK